MKVIKDPVPVSWSIEMECIADVDFDDLGCGAILEVDISDIYLKKQLKYGWSDFYDESYSYTDQSYVFKCPCCGKETSIKNNQIPEKIRKFILNREKEKKKEINNQKSLNKN